MLTIFHSNQVCLQNGVVHVDRKFHTGMQQYLQRLHIPIVSIHPRLPSQALSSIMDRVSIPEKELGYKVVTVSCDSRGYPSSSELARLREIIGASRLVYGGALGSPRLCKESGVPYVPVLENTLRTQMTFVSCESSSRLHARVRAAGITYQYVRQIIPLMRDAACIHCNGYPMYNEARWFNPRRLLYLDSRLAEDSIISRESLRERLAGRHSRVPRLIFSGRLEAIKGPLYLIDVAAKCRSRGLPFELHIYGQGSQRVAVEQAIHEGQLHDQVKLFDSVCYPELIKRASECDLFLCCHIQGDPSCTYLESLGCGLPIVGFDNAMWKGMHAHSGAGTVTKMGDAVAMADAICRLLADSNLLDRLSYRATEFARQHTFEKEFTRRTNSIEHIMSCCSPPPGRQALSSGRRSHHGVASTTVLDNLTKG